MSGTSGSTLSAGSSAQGAVGNTAQVVGNPASSFYQSVMPAVFAAAILDVVQDRSKSPGMSPGQSLTSAVGGAAEVYALSGSPMGAQMMTTLAEVGIVGSLLKMGTSSTYSPEQQASAQTQEDQRKAAIALEDAQKQEAQAAEDRRQAYFSKPPSMG